MTTCINFNNVNLLKILKFECIINVLITVVFIDSECWFLRFGNTMYNGKEAMTLAEVEATGFEKHEQKDSDAFDRVAGVLKQWKGYLPTLTCAER